MSRTIIVDPAVGTVTAAHVRRGLPNATVTEPADVTVALDEMEGPTALVVTNRCWRDAYLEGLCKGDWVTTIGVGYDALPVAALADRGVVVTNSAGINAVQVAEHAFALVLSVTRLLGTYRNQQYEQMWEKHRFNMTDLGGDVCCVLGLGAIGEAVARRAAAFDMTVRGVKRGTADYDGSADAVYPPERLAAALREARLLVIAVPLTPQTEGMVGRAELAALTDDAIVVNVARGPILDTEQLLAALDKDAIAAACLDVTDPEPLPPDHPLWSRDDVVLTPHCAGLSDKYPERFLACFSKQWSRWIAGEAVPNRISQPSSEGTC